MRSRSAGGVIVDDFDNDGLLRRRHLELRHLRAACTSSTTTATARSPTAPRQPGLATQLGGPEHRPGRLQQRRLPGHPGPARRLGNAAAQLAAAQQLRRHLHRRHGGERPGRAGDQHADGGLGRHRQRRLARSLRRQRERRRAQLFRNKGDGTFEDISRAGRRRPARRSPRAWSAADYDNDGYPDLYVSNYRRRQLPLSQQPRRHVHRRRAAGAASRASATASPTWFFDYDNDGWLDLFVDQLLRSRSTRPSRTYLGLPHNADDAEAVSQPGQRHLHAT